MSAEEGSAGAAKWIVSASASALLGAASAASGGQIPLLAAFDLGIHELGHLLTMAWAGDWLTAFAGSFMQVAVPLGLSLYFALHRKERWAAAPLLAWAGTSMHNVAVYLGDAPYRRLPLLGDQSGHDWAFLLQGKPMMMAEQIAALVTALGFLLVLGALAMCWSGWRGEREDAVRARAEEARLDSLPRREPRSSLLDGEGD